MDNERKAPVIPMGTTTAIGGSPVYDPLIAATIARETGQANSLPTTGEPVGQLPQTSYSQAPSFGTTYDELVEKKKFNSPEELAQAYKNLESRTAKVEMNLSELARSRQEQDDSLDINKVATQEDAIKVVEKIVKKATRPLEDKLELQNLFLKNPDAQQYAGEMAKLVKENPGINWDVAYRAAKFDALESKAREQGKQEAYQTMELKKSVATETAKVSNKNERSLEDLIRDKNVPFSEVDRIIRERFRQ